VSTQHWTHSCVCLSYLLWEPDKTRRGSCQHQRLWHMRKYLVGRGEKRIAYDSGNQLL
jgi:hypothetical protein